MSQEQEQQAQSSSLDLRSSRSKSLHFFYFFQINLILEGVFLLATVVHPKSRESVVSLPAQNVTKGSLKKWPILPTKDFPEMTWSLFHAYLASSHLKTLVGYV